MTATQCSCGCAITGSRVQLARKKLSRYDDKIYRDRAPSTQSRHVDRLIGVSDLKLRWPDVPGHPRPPAPVPSRSDLRAAWLAQLPSASWLRPSEPAAELTVSSKGRRRLEQTYAYLGPAALPPIGLCRTWRPMARLRNLIPLGNWRESSVGQRWCSLPAPYSHRGGRWTTQLARRQIEADIPSLELCLLDINAAAVPSAYHCTPREPPVVVPQVNVWARFGNFHPSAPLRRYVDPRLARRLITILGEPWRIWITSRGLCSRVSSTATATICCCWIYRWLRPLRRPGADPAARPALRQRRTGPYAAWLGSSYGSHCPHAERIEFHWELETGAHRRQLRPARHRHRSPQSRRAERRFSVFRIAR